MELGDLIDIALEAGREIMALRAQGVPASRKDDGSPVTAADLRAEQIIERALARLAPDIPMIGEESVAGGHIPRAGRRYFCVDPLDGTRGFVRGSDAFTVNIALIEDGVPTTGVIFAPATGALYAAEPGYAVTGKHADTQQLTPLKPRTETPKQWRVLASERSGRNQATAAFAAALKGSTRYASSSIKFCWLAEDSADLYPRFGAVHEWDIAAGHALLRALGGGIMRLDGAPLRYGDPAQHYLVDGFVAFTSPQAEDAARRALGL